MSEAYSKEIKTSQDHNWKLVEDDTDIGGFLCYQCSDCGLFYDFKPRRKRRTPGSEYEYGRFDVHFYLPSTGNVPDTSNWWRDKNEPTCAHIKMLEALE